jgi:ferredoxin
MQVAVDQAKCQGHAQCSAHAPEVFVLDDEGYVAIDGALSVAPEQEEAAALGVAACPERALTISS